MGPEGNKKAFRYTFFVATAMTLMAAQGFAGEGKALSDNETDSINAKGFSHHRFFLSENEQGKGFAFLRCPKEASVINIVNSAESDVANQTNVAAARGGLHMDGLYQSNPI